MHIGVSRSMQQKLWVDAASLGHALISTQTATEAARSLNISRRALFYHLKMVDPRALVRELVRQGREARNDVQHLRRRVTSLQASCAAAEERSRQLGETVRLLHLRYGHALVPDPARIPLWTAYETLAVHPNAPWEVVQAAYRALTRLHHTDTGGETRAMQTINAAYQAICQRDQAVGDW